MKSNIPQASSENTSGVYSTQGKFDAEEFTRQLVEKGRPTDEARKIAHKMQEARANNELAKSIPKREISLPGLKQVNGIALVRKTRKDAESPRQLPLWSDWERAMPTPITRSAVFAPIGRGERKHLKNGVINSRSDVVLTYTGEQLDMSDADVFMQALELAKRHPIGTEFIVNRAEFLTDIGRAYESKNTAKGTVRKRAIGSQTYEWLDTSMKRLREGSLDFRIKETAKRKAKGGILNLIKTWKWDNDLNSYLLAIDPEIYKLFESFSRIYLDKHMALPKTDQLAKWMHWFVAGCDKNKLTKIGLDHLRTYSANTHRRMDHFSNSMERALQALQDAEVIAPGWFIRTNNLMLHFTRIV